MSRAGDEGTQRCGSGVRSRLGFPLASARVSGAVPGAVYPALGWQSRRGEANITIPEEFAGLAVLKERGESNPISQLVN